MDMKNDRAKSIFGNDIDERTYKSACASKRRYERMFGKDGACPLGVEEPPVIEFNADRPFIFAVTGVSGAPLFVGTVSDPS